MKMQENSGNSKPCTAFWYDSYWYKASFYQTNEASFILFIQVIPIEDNFRFDHIYLFMENASGHFWSNTQY